MFRYPELFKTGIAIAFISHQKLYDTVYQERYMNTPQNNPEGYEETAPVKYAKNLKGNLLLIHGTGDTLVRPEYSQRAYEAYKASCPEGMSEEDRVSLHLIEGGGHGFNEEQDQLCIGYIKSFAESLLK
jgi:dipeptidyl aminopeptidase/acylaminoacyl peptidase